MHFISEVKIDLGSHNKSVQSHLSESDQIWLSVGVCMISVYIFLYVYVRLLKTINQIMNACSLSLYIHRM